MGWINNLKTSVKLLSAFGAVIVLLTVTAGVGIYSIGVMGNEIDQIYNDRTLPIEWVGNANSALYKLRGDVYKYLLIPEERAATRQAIMDDQQIIRENMDKYRQTFLVAEEEKALQEFDAAFERYIAAVNEAIKNIDTGNLQAAQTSINDGGAVANARKEIGREMDDIISINSRIAGEVHDQSTVLEQNVRLILIGVALLALALGALKSC